LPPRMPPHVTPLLRNLTSSHAIEDQVPSLPVPLFIGIGSSRSRVGVTSSTRSPPWCPPVPLACSFDPPASLRVCASIERRLKWVCIQFRAGPFPLDCDCGGTLSLTLYIAKSDPPTLFGSYSPTVRCKHTTPTPDRMLRFRQVGLGGKDVV
jgi:hypothetical protein